MKTLTQNNIKFNPLNYELLSKSITHSLGYKNNTLNDFKLKNLNLLKIKASERFNLCLGFDLIERKNRLISFGEGSTGQLGVKGIGQHLDLSKPFIREVKEPTIINLRFEPKFISASLSNSYSVSLDNKIYSTGLNTDLQLGHSFDKPLSQTFEQVDLNLGIINQIDSNGDTCAVLSNDGNVVGWGNSEYGSLCGDKFEDRGVQPRNLTTYLDNEGCSTIVKFSVGGAHMWFLDNHGRVFASGLNVIDQKPIQSFKPIDLKIPLKAINIWSGLHHSLALLEDRTFLVSGPQLNDIEIISHMDSQTFDNKLHSNNFDVSFTNYSIHLH